MVFTIFARQEYESAEALERARPFLLAHRRRCLDSEPGTLQLDFSRDNENDRVLMLYEAYVDRPAFDAHWTGESITRLRAEFEAQGIRFQGKGTRCTLLE